MAIIKAKQTDLDQCTDILFDSELGRNYYPTRALLLEEVEKGINSDEVYVKKLTRGGSSLI